MPYKPIDAYGIIGNMHSAALVGTDGSIDWCCLPVFDSPSVFAAILDDSKGGRFRINPLAPGDSRQAYIPDTNVLRTTFSTESGTAVITDFMPCYRTAGGRLVQPPEIHRHVDCTRGEITLDVFFQPKLDYARSETRLTPSRHGVTAEDGKSSLSLSSEISLDIDNDKASGRFTMKQGEHSTFILRYGAGKPAGIKSHRPELKLEGTTAYWRDQALACICPGKYRDTIVRSYLTLHLLVYSPTGAIIAAPTTSLPEQIGGERNWDYRYSWLRDASFTLNAFSRLGHKEEAVGFLKYLLSVCDMCGDKAQILYDINFSNPLDEQTLDHLEGYRESRPVRIGNGAYQQLQLDVFGEVLDAANNFLDIGGYISHRDWALLKGFVDAACRLWPEPDNGIWEVRGGPYHFVHSKMMCWVAVDRGIKLAERLDYQTDTTRWRDNAAAIRTDILKNGWDPERGSFIQRYESKALDASNLLMPLYGFLPVNDDKIISTIEHTTEELGHDGLLHRYLTDETDDGLKGAEGMFLWCSFWLVRNYIRLGRLDEATALYEKLLSHGNHLGLFPEMVDPDSGEALGNFPQALTHLATIITGLELTEALEK